MTSKSTLVKNAAVSSAAPVDAGSPTIASPSSATQVQSASQSDLTTMATHGTKRTLTTSPGQSPLNKKTRIDEAPSTTSSGKMYNQVEPEPIKAQHRVPIEVFKRLIQTIKEADDIATLICLALTSKQLWKYAREDKLLTRSVTTNLSPSVKKKLTKLLQKWMGKKFRVAGQKVLAHTQKKTCNVMFLRRKIYGNKANSEEEMELVRRYKDVDEMKIPVRVPGRKPDYAKLPSPFGMGPGDEWFEACLYYLIEPARIWLEEDGEGSKSERKRWDRVMWCFWDFYHRSSLKEWVDDEDHPDEDNEDGHYGDHYELMGTKDELREIERFLSPYSTTKGEY